ncbi:MAG TPA: glycoside hydrolase family 97 protein [Ohtaekwangia sp.]
MIKNTLLLCSLLWLVSFPLAAQKTKSFDVSSPDGSVVVHITASATLQWSVQHAGQPILSPSVISMTLGDGTVLGANANVTSHKTEKINTQFSTINYTKSKVQDVCNLLTLTCKGDYGVLFRVYNDAVAYRFFTKKKTDITIAAEESNFNFPEDYHSFIPIQWDYRGGENFNSSFEALYHEIKLSQFPKDSLGFLPLLVDVGQGKKVAILEADLEEYPGMYVNLNGTGKGLKGVFAPYPLEFKSGGYANMNVIPTKRATYIAKVKGSRNFPWRVITISKTDKELLSNDIVQKLAAPTRLADITWIEPGQVSWDWWNNWNVSHVDFKAGINTETYKYYIDFAAAGKIKYIVIDDGWSDRLDLLKLSSAINLEEIIRYGKDRGVGVILWASWYAVTTQMEKAFPLYSKMGVRGFKIDFIDRDDQIAVSSLYDIAKKAAEHKLLVDYHGVFKPTGLQRTYPNVIGYEGVKGLENVKWANEDAPRYAVSIPFIRMLAGPMDYTPGAMRNANRANFRPVNDNPMSQGTRCHQLAMYVMYDAPLQMLADNPTIYKRENECTDFIIKVPTTFDETIPLDGKVAEYAAIARRKGTTWYIGAMTNWTPRELQLDLSFLPGGTYQAEVFKDGVNADRDATDYKKETLKVSSGDKVNIQLSPGGGWAARFEKLD